MINAYSTRCLVSFFISQRSSFEIIRVPFLHLILVFYSMSQNMRAAIQDEYMRRRHDFIIASIEEHFGRKLDYWKDLRRWSTVAEGQTIVILVDGQRIGAVVTDYPDNVSRIEDIEIKFVPEVKSPG
ncbi:MAG: hypothetical protein JWQ30_1037 [Sediminibacterium sp.]|nr:hypothetical protein [Sediminibacterium sp.]